MASNLIKRGFTLIEVVIALAIFALATYALSQSFLTGLLSLERVRDDDWQEQQGFLWLRREAYRSDSGINWRRASTPEKLSQELSFIPAFRALKYAGDVKSTAVRGVFITEGVMTLQSDTGEEQTVDELVYLFAPQWAKE